MAQKENETFLAASKKGIYSFIERKKRHSDILISEKVSAGLLVKLACTFCQLEVENIM